MEWNGVDVFAEGWLVDRKEKKKKKEKKEKEGQ